MTVTNSEQTIKNTMTTGCRIPQDLTFKILLRLPAKSVLRFKCVSKLWSSIISSQQFINAFMSLSRPRLLLGFSDFDDEPRVLFFSAPHQICSFFEESSTLVSEKNTLTMPKAKSNIDYICNSVRGFLCCSTNDGFVVCNPTTRQVISVAEDKNEIFDYYCRMYLGYDPKNDQYKLLRLIAPGSPPLRIQHSVCTLGGKGSSQSWRPIKTSILYDYCYQNGVCIDGVVYYEYKNKEHHRKIGSFDVGSEQLHLIETPEDLLDDLNNNDALSCYLANYLEKLAVYCYYNDNGFILWVLDDVKNQVWSKKTCLFPHSILWSLRFGGIGTSGEIVYVPEWFSYSDSCELLCYDVEKNMDRRVRLEGLSNLAPFSPLMCFYVDNIIYL